MSKEEKTLSTTPFTHSHSSSIHYAHRYEHYFIALSSSRCVIRFFSAVFPSNLAIPLLGCENTIFHFCCSCHFIESLLGALRCAPLFFRMCRIFVSFHSNWSASRTPYPLTFCENEAKNAEPISTVE